MGKLMPHGYSFVLRVDQSAVVKKRKNLISLKSDDKST